MAAWGIAPDAFYRAVAAVTGMSAEFRVDLVNPEDCSSSLRQAMVQEGVVLYANTCCVCRLAFQVLHDDLTDSTALSGVIADEAPRFQEWHSSGECHSREAITVCRGDYT
jgi:hypothetical protein